MTKIHFILLLLLGLASSPAQAQWVTRDHRAPTRGPWMWTIPRELPELYREFNGIDFGHAHLAETLLRTQDAKAIERARVEVLEFIDRSPAVPPDEEQIAPIFTRLVWEAQKTFHWAHRFHRSLYDLFAADHVEDKEAAYRHLLNHYLSMPEAITPVPLDHHGRLWSFPESKAFRDQHPKFNSQIWAYHWLQAAAYDVQLIGPAAQQRALMRPVIEHYHGYLRNPPIQWRMMPMMAEAAPEFSRRYPEATAIFDNLHMLHDNIDDVLSRADLFPNHRARRIRILQLRSIYLHRNQQAGLHAEFRGRPDDHHEMGPRPPSVQEVLKITPPASPAQPGPAEHPHHH